MCGVGLSRTAAGLLVPRNGRRPVGYAEFLDNVVEMHPYGALTEDKPARDLGVS